MERKLNARYWRTADIGRSERNDAFDLKQALRCDPFVENDTDEHGAHLTQLLHHGTLLLTVSTSALMAGPILGGDREKGRTRTRPPAGATAGVAKFNSL